MENLNPYQSPQTASQHSGRSWRGLCFPLTIAYLLGFATGAAIVALGANIISAMAIKALGGE